MVLAANLIRQFGLKATPQRLAVYSVLQDRCDHPTVEQVYETVRERHPTISLNTVYRTLESLETAGAVRRLSTGAQAARYDATLSPHAHLVCTACGSVRDLFGSLAEQLPDLARVAAGESGFHLRHADLNLFGTCPDCRASSG